MLANFCYVVVPCPDPPSREEKGLVIIEYFLDCVNSAALVLVFRAFPYYICGKEDQVGG